MQSSFLPLPTVKLLERVCTFILPRAEVTRGNIRELDRPSIVILVAQRNEHIHHFGVASELFFDPWKVIFPRIHPTRIDPAKTVQRLNSVLRRARIFVIRRKTTPSFQKGTSPLNILLDTVRVFDQLLVANLEKSRMPAQTSSGNLSPFP